jgi:uncharacterized membrane protein YeaQ/YmgE (transglycosylase-associated protein family)
MGQWALVALIGLILGAAIFLPARGKIRGGLVLTMLVGAIAALAMTWIGSQLGIVTQGSTIAFFFAVIGTGLVLAVWRVTMSRA